VAADPETVSVVAPEVVSASVGIPVSAAALETCSAAVDPKVFSVVALEAGFVAADPKIVSVVDQAEAFAAVAPEAVSVDIAFAFVVLVPASVVVAEADSSERPRFLVFPNVDHFASFSSSVEVDGEESVHSPIGAHTNYGLCSIFSSLDLHHNRNLEWRYNIPNHGYNTGSDTNDLPMDATTSHPRKTSRYQYPAQRKHRLYRASRLHPEVRQTEAVEGGWLRQTHSLLKKHNGRSPRIRYDNSCNKPSPHIVLVREC